jgi:hypothetical protein
MIRCAFAGQMQPVDRIPRRCELVELVDSTSDRRRSRADHARLAAQDPRRDVADLVRLAVGDDRVARVRAAVVAADEVGVLGEQVDDLALAFVSPTGRLRLRSLARGASLPEPAAPAPGSRSCTAPSPTSR